MSTIDQPYPSTGHECANSQHYGCDPDRAALKCNVWRGERFVETVNLCCRCRSAVKLEGFDVLEDTCPVCDGGHGNNCACSCHPDSKKPI